MHSSPENLIKQANECTPMAALQVTNINIKKERNASTHSRPFPVYLSFHNLSTEFQPYLVKRQTCFFWSQWEIKFTLGNTNAVCGEALLLSSDTNDCDLQGIGGVKKRSQKYPTFKTHILVCDFFTFTFQVPPHLFPPTHSLHANIFSHMMHQIHSGTCWNCNCFYGGIRADMFLVFSWNGWN